MSTDRHGSPAAPGAPTRGSLTPLWVMVGVFAAPVLAAWFFYLNPGYLPSGRANLGELIVPVVALPSAPDVVGADGAPFDQEPLAGKWTLVFLAGTDCEDSCRNRLHDLRQIRLALGEASLNTERLLILTGQDALPLAGELALDYRGMRVAVTDHAGGQQLLDQLGGDDALGRIYILDPMGNLMMRYALTAPSKDILKDIGRLIKASKNWIKGAGYGHN